MLLKNIYEGIEILNALGDAFILWVIWDVNNICKSLSTL